ncbi:MAG: tryptophan--tRNA ligase [Buchnera aphidicola (Periphyllus acericola)]|uniref:tryptophan--tRNA ligase n=1 Tax=Buchnera aphidicola TaxID=9 RepID=UPI0030D1D92B|nr:tryptophan--tRNA ligase [Buchnera aphidicola (Periphyllus acericola)]
MNKKKIKVFSAIQPSGSLTIGNYISVLRHWKKMQKKYQCIFCIADLHSLTSLHKEDNFLRKKSILDTLAIYLACGVNPKKSIIFVQSSVHEHSSLNWILNCHTYYNELIRMTQFKNKIFHVTEKINTGLFNYPTLMAADILLYQTDKVHVGRDQKQHIELTRNIATRFNSRYGKIFKIPELLIYNLGSKIMSLMDPRKKMSKSDLNKKNVIFLLENSKEILKKIKCSITDSDVPPKISFDSIYKPGISNLLEILSALVGKSIHELEQHFIKKSYSDLKKEVYHSVDMHISKIQKKFFIYRKDKDFLKKIFLQGTNKASKIAKKNLKKVYKSLGLF